MLKFEEKPASYELIFKGSYNKQPFTVMDKNGKIYVNFDKRYECDTNEYLEIIDKIEKKYAELHKKDKRWHN